MRNDTLYFDLNYFRHFSEGIDFFLRKLKTVELEKFQLFFLLTQHDTVLITQIGFLEGKLLE